MFSYSGDKERNDWEPRVYNREYTVALLHLSTTPYLGEFLFLLLLFTFSSVVFLSTMVGNDFTVLINFVFLRRICRFRRSLTLPHGDEE